MTHVLIALAMIAAYVVLLLVKPDRRCGRCGGWGARGKRRRRLACTRCGGSGRRFRPGAPLVHRGKALVIRRARERLEGGR